MQPLIKNVFVTQKILQRFSTKKSTSMPDYNQMFEQRIS